MSHQRIGIYGGTFSPPHFGHRRALEAFIAQERLDAVYVIPALMPPHKQLQGDATPEQRLAMCKLAFVGLPVTVSDIEIRRGGKSYTVLTLEELKAADTTLVMLCGTDMFLTLDKWYQPERIFELAEIVFVQRETGEAGDGIPEKLKKQQDFLRQTYHATTRPLACDALMISSSDLRTAIQGGCDTSAYLAPQVRRYIDTWNLYRA
ncbi:MAG: nicotinate (nicotinamide) nucleotide adenylyltransferase [Clostridia bacterium]|nr:nicotinate (nicotinamide) nucleotide adenylyltransferase [Clostridia bacterium]